MTFAALPIPATSLVGREREIEQVQAILNWPEVSLLSLTGPGGVGKTRLVLEVARRLAPGFPDGVVFVPLGALERSHQVLPAVAQALGLQESGGDVEDVVGAHLATRQLLLILDNFEHVLEAAPALGEVLRRTPEVTVLVTSRERLHLYGEHEFPVPPLGLSSPGAAEGEAARLFRERARAARPDAALGDVHSAVIEDICRQLDGLPLAIELAAARTRVLGLGELRDRLGRRLALLTGGARDLPARQQTLRAAIDWSHGLLEAHEQRLMARLAVFVGSWTLPAAEAVCGAGGLDVLAGLASLVDKSLVHSSAQGPRTRYRMLETVREYALDQFQDRPEAEEIRRAHGRYFLALSGALDALVRGHGSAEIDDISAGFRQLDEERPNILAALHHAARMRDEAALGAFASHLAPLSSSSLDSSAAPLLLGALEAVGHRGVAAGWLHYALAFLAYRRGRLDEAAATAARSVAAFEDTRDERGLAYARQVRAFATMATDPPAAWQDLTASLTWAVPHHDSLLSVMCLSMRASGALLTGRPADVRSDLDLALDLTRGVHNHIGRGWIRLILAALELRSGQLAEAEALLCQVVTVGHRLDLPDLQISGLIGLAALLAQRGRPALALEYWTVAQTLQTTRNYNASLLEALCEPWLGPLLARQHDPELLPAVHRGHTADVAALLQSLSDHGLPAEDPPAPPDRAPAPFPLTPREREVLALLAQGLSNKQIAARLGSGVYTVNDQVKAVFGKLGVNNRAAATRAALEHGLS